MIFLILGTQKFQLNRLLIKIDEYIACGKITDTVIAQVGNSDYIPQNYVPHKFFSKEEFDNHINNADLIITHSGVGSIITGLKAKKPVIIFPRLAKHKEHVDDHQLDIATAFGKKEYVLCCNEEDDLSELIEKSKTFVFQEYQSQTDRIIGIIEEFLEERVI